MCGRFTQTSEVAGLEVRFRVAQVCGRVEPRFNIAPTDLVAAVLREGGTRLLDAVRWGLVPSWAKSIKSVAQPINARAEGLATSPMFRRLVTGRRCLIPADGFYEWSGAGKARRPVRIHLRSSGLFAFAGLWDGWRDPATPAAPELRSCAIITIAANELVGAIHDRMPVILAPEDEARWLDPTLPLAAVQALLRPFPAEQMALYPVSQQVNNVRNQGPDCILPAA